MIVHDESYNGSLKKSVFETGRNCWHVEQASYAAIVIDSANYYRALHQSICRAQRSIFILGWDVDSRIELLRGEEAQNSRAPSKFFDLIEWKARQNPDIAIYIDRWDFLLYLAMERENFSKLKWRLSPANIHYCMDGVIPVGACHHQKIIVIDDQIAFSGGMDIALARWDQRQHYPRNKNRIDPAGTYEHESLKPFGPHHDVQMLVAGPVVRPLTELARERWHLATGVKPIPVCPMQSTALPEVWPPSVTPDFIDVLVAIALTIPPIYGHNTVRQVEQLYFDMIDCAERFIYIENQFLSQKEIAAALNYRLRQMPELRILLISSDHPEGVMERKSMWYGRVLFRDILEAGGVASRVVMAYPISRVDSSQQSVRIHSKVMIVDDLYLRVGSSNINNRSMAFDTECDLVIYGDDEKKRTKIAALRNDFIREHTGMESDAIEHVIGSGASPDIFTQDAAPHSRQHLRRINDKPYRQERFARIATALADPKKPLISGALTMPYRYSGLRRSLLMRLIFSLLLIILISAPVLFWSYSSLAGSWLEAITPFLQKMQHASWGVLTALAIFIIGGIVFFPITVLITVTTILFSPLQGFSIAFSGSLISAAVGYLLGRLLGRKSLRALLGIYADKVCHYVGKGGVMGITILRMIPVAPFTAVNLTLGMTGISFPVFMIATCLGILPGLIAFSFLGHSLATLWRNPAPEQIFYAAIGIIIWLLMVVLSHFAARSWQQRTEGGA